MLTVDSQNLEYFISWIFRWLEAILPFNITHFFRQKNSRYLECLGKSNKIVGPFDDFLSFSQTSVLVFGSIEKLSIQVFESQLYLH